MYHYCPACKETTVHRDMGQAARHKYRRIKCLRCHYEQFMGPEEIRDGGRSR